MLSRTRINLLVFLLFLASGLIFYRLFYLSYFQHNSYSKLAESQYQNQKGSTVKRGDIYIQDLGSGEKHLVATQRAFPFIYVRPRDSKDPSLSAAKLAELMNIDSQEAIKIFNKKEDAFEVVEKSPTASQVEAVRSLNAKEIMVGYEERRYYPEHALMAQVLGFLGFNGDERRGQYGIEAFYDKNLSGQTATKLDLFGAKGLFSFFRPPKNVSEDLPQDGDSLTLTIDKNIQLFAEQELSHLMAKWHPVSATLIVEDPQSGAILAMAGSPSFDLNNYSRYPLASFTNKNIQEMFEPGSSFKPITLSSALDKKVIAPESTYTDTGEVDLAGYKIKNFNEKAYGVQTMAQVLEKSLNTGAMYVENKLGDDIFLNYVINFGFGQPTGIDLSGEVSGDISNLYSKRKINFATASFGQGIAVTPLQLVNAYAAIANGGKLYRPYIVQEITKPGGEKIRTKPELIGTPISERTALQMKAMLVNVVEKGFDKATVKGYDVAGKTGTAQVASKTGGYSDEFIHDIVGFAPAFSPRFVILIKMERPQGIKFAADSLSPSLGKITRFLLNYFQIPPTK